MGHFLEQKADRFRPLLFSVKVVVHLLQGVANVQLYLKAAPELTFSEYYRPNAVEELEETMKAHSRLTPGLPGVIVKSIENVIGNDGWMALSLTYSLCYSAGRYILVGELSCHRF